MKEVEQMKKKEEDDMSAFNDYYNYDDGNIGKGRKNKKGGSSVIYQLLMSSLLAS